MKKIFGFMVFAGMLLAVATAGGFDSGIIGANRIFVQSVIAAVLIYTGSHFMERGEEA